MELKILARTAIPLFLLGRTNRVTVRTENTTLPLPGFKLGVTFYAGIIRLAVSRGHELFFGVSALRTGNGGFE